MSRMLEGIRIVDLTSVVMGPYAMQILGDMGADVIKVERPEGDIMRHMGRCRSEHMGPIHLSVNRNKRSIVLDLKHEEAREALAKIVTTADVFVHSMRPRAMEKLGFGYEQVKKLNPRIVYCGAYGYSQDGPYAQKAAYDDIIQGLSGMCGINSHMLGRPQFSPTILADKIGGLTIAYAILGALFHQQKYGEGQCLEVPMLETMVSFLMIEHMWQRTFDLEKGEAGYPRILTQLRKPHRTKDDGYLCIMPYTDRNWIDLFEVSGRAETAKDERYSTAHARSLNYETLFPMLAEIVAEKTTAEWLAILERLSIAGSVVNSLEDLYDDPHLKAVGMFFGYEHPSEGPINLVKAPVKFSARPFEVTNPPPRLGQHGEEILRDAGVSAETIAAMKAKGATH
jgi:crotonobetainyl-CoA:carnitine CoA-transferase CaiB-like acyl-CoA transferase